MYYIETIKFNIRTTVEETIKERGELFVDYGQNLPILVINIVIFTVYNDKLCIILVPDKDSATGELILPGGLVMKGYSLVENLDDIVYRKVGLKNIYREQLYTFGNPNRSKPDSHFITITYFSLVNKYKLQNYVDLTKVSVVEYANIDNLNIGLNHRKIIKFAKNKLNFRLEYTTIGKYVLPPKFTIPSMQRKYEIIYGEEFDKRNFRKKVEQFNIVRFTGEYDKTNSYRPAKLYEFLESDIKYLDVDRINLEFHGNAELNK